MEPNTPQGKRAALRDLKKYGSYQGIREHYRKVIIEARADQIAARRKVEQSLGRMRKSQDAIDAERSFMRLCLVLGSIAIGLLLGWLLRASST